MGRASSIQNAANAGEFSPLLFGRQDLEQYKKALATCRNAIVLAQGAWTRCPGTLHVAATKDSATRQSRLLPFQYSLEQAYLLEFGHQYIRVYADYAVVGSDVVTTYTEDELPQITITQSADTLYIFHPDHPPRKLVRTTLTSFTLSTISFKDGPYEVLNTTTTTLTPAATSGNGVVVTASATSGINKDAGFQSTDVGRLLRLKNTATWGWAVIATVTSTTLITVNIQSAFAGTVATTDWRLGLWSDTTGYPPAGTFFEDRLVAGGVAVYPQRFDLSKSGEYENFAPSGTDGTVADNNAIGYTMGSDQVNGIRWFKSAEKGLLVGTAPAVWAIKPSTLGAALTPTNVSGKPSTNFGSAAVQPVSAGKAVLYVQRGGTKLRELAYVFEVDGFRAPDMTLLAEHITKPTIEELVYQQLPQSIVWARRSDGAILPFTYERDNNVTGWGTRVLAGDVDADGNPAEVESMCVLPSPDGTRDELYLIVKRWLNGGTVRHIERMAKVWESGDEQADAYFADAGKSVSVVTASATVSGMSWLNGQTVGVLADGALHPDCVVVSGAITLSYPANVVQVGLRYPSDGVTMPLDGGAADGSAQGKDKNIYRVGFWLMDTLGLQFGPSFDELTELIEARYNDEFGEPPALFTGVRRESFSGGTDQLGQVYWRADTMFPATVLANMPQFNVEDDT